MTAIELILFFPARECTLKVQAETNAECHNERSTKARTMEVFFYDIECDMVGIVLRADYNCIVI
jgi:hypothetical protein